MNYIKGPSYNKVPHFAKINPSNTKAYIPILAFWGAATMWGIFTFTEGVPKFQKTFYQKIPYFGEHWEYNPDPEDVPV